MVGVLVAVILFFEVALEFELGAGLGLVDDDLGYEGIVIVLSMFVGGVDDLF